MGKLNRGLKLLENRSQERAAEEIRRAWHRLTDAEIAKLVAPFRFGREPTPEEGDVAEAFRKDVPEDLLARAIGLRADEADIGRRMTVLVAPILKRRRSGVLRKLALMEGR